VQPQTDKLVAVLRFSELFGTAFKTRVNGAACTTRKRHRDCGRIRIQNIPARSTTQVRFISNFTTPGSTLLRRSPILSAVSLSALAWGFMARASRRLQHIPTGVSVWVSALNLIGAMALLVLLRHWCQSADHFTELPNWLARGWSRHPIPLQTGSVAAMAAASLFYRNHRRFGKSSRPSNTTENYDFGVYITFKNNIPQQRISATLSYAPTPTAPFSASAAGLASNSLTIRVRVAAAASGTNFLNINLCTTALLFPYVRQRSWSPPIRLRHGYSIAIHVRSFVQPPRLAPVRCIGTEALPEPSHPLPLNPLHNSGRGRNWSTVPIMTEPRLSRWRRRACPPTGLAT